MTKFFIALGFQHVDNSLSAHKAVSYLSFLPVSSSKGLRQF
jgi:hypothetical protein